MDLEYIREKVVIWRRVISGLGCVVKIKVRICCYFCDYDVCVWLVILIELNFDCKLNVFCWLMDWFGGLFLVKEYSGEMVGKKWV